MKVRLALACSLMMMATSVFAAEILTTYKQISQAANAGESVYAIVHFNNCFVKGKPNEPGPNVSTRMNFDVFSNYPMEVDKQTKNMIASSNTMFLEHSKLGMVLAYGRLRIFEDGIAEYHAEYFEPATLKSKLIWDFMCRLSNGSDGNGAVVFVRPR